MSNYILTSMFPNGFSGQIAEVFRRKINKRRKFAFIASEFEKLHEKTDKYLVLHKKWCMNKSWVEHLFHDPLDNEPLAA